MANRLTVHDRSGAPIYDIALEPDFGRLRHEVSALGTAGKRICVVTDSNVANLYAEEVRELLSGVCRQTEVFVFPAGEEQKNLDTVRRLYEFLILHEFDRGDMLAALGGGVVGDLCGYAAATYLRGISFLQIPTTLLAQVDSSIGGKTGVDFDCYKNMVGAFHMPKLVYTNLSTLKTLDESQFSSGMGEVIKHGLIKDREYYEWLGSQAEEIGRRDLSACEAMILVSNRIKRDVVEQDPREQGERALLNFGHTLGHAIEKQMNFTMLHGHCVGLGCLAAAEISARRGMITESQVRGLEETLKSFGLPTSLSGLDLNGVLLDTKHDKKMDAGTIKFILLRAMGQAYVDRTVTEEEMRLGLEAIIR